MATAGGILTNYTFSGPFMAGRITDKQGRKYPLWLNPKELLSGDFGVIKDLPYVQEVTVELGLGLVPQIKVVLNPPHHEAQKILDSPLIEWPGNVLEVQLGYSEGSQAVMSPIFSGMLLKPDIELGEEISITLNAQGVGGYSGLRLESRRTFKNTKRIDIIKEILKGPDKKAERRVEVLDTVKAKEARKLLDKKINYSQAGQADMLAITQIVQDCKCWYSWEGRDIKDKSNKDKFVLYSKEERMASVPKRIFSFFDPPDKKLVGGEFRAGEMGPNVGIYPIINLSSPTAAIYMPGAIRGMVIQDIDSKTRKRKVEVVNDKNQRIPRIGTGAAWVISELLPDTDDKEGDGATSYTVGLSDQAKAAVEGEFQRVNSDMGVKLTIDTIGIPDLLPSESITVTGIGTRLSGKGGNYSVMKLTHQWGTGGTSTNFECMSNVVKVMQAAVNVQGPVGKAAPQIAPSSVSKDAKKGP